MIDSNLGIALALSAWILWSTTPFFFTSTGRRIGAFATNLTRLLLASLLLILLCAVMFLISPSTAFPSASAWILLGASGSLGLGLGDNYLYKSLAEAGPERTSLLMTLSPAMTVTLAWIFLREILSPIQLGAMLLILGGVVAACWPKKFSGGSAHRWSHSWSGIIAALCQSIGTIFARQAFVGSANLSPVYATTVRVGSGMLFLLIFALATRKLWPSIQKARQPGMPLRILGGTLTGPVVGMLCYIGALKYQSAGIVTTITFMTPLLIIPVATWRYKARLTGRVLLGGVAALAGVALLGWNP